MSRFISREAGRLEPYVPGEQPVDMQYIKLNTNESPFPPSTKVVEAVSRSELLKLNLYSDPTCDQLVRAIAHRYELKPEQVLAGNGSDELLSFAFRAFCGEGNGVAFPDVSYGFYKVWAAFYGVEAKVVPLKADFTIDADDYMDWAVRGVQSGAGEIVLNSIDTDGVKQGFDLEMLDELTGRVDVPVIASGGAGKMEDFGELFTHPGIDAGLAASIFHTRQVDIKELKRWLRSRGVEMRI